MLHHLMRECCVCQLHLSTVLKRKHQSLRGLEQQPRGNPSPTALFRNAWLKSSSYYSKSHKLRFSQTQILCEAQ